MGIENIDLLKEGSDEDLGSIADGDQVPDSEEEISQTDGPIDPAEADECSGEDA